ncbi:transmembrane emp24 domain-containing protein p24delta9-like [Aristolochia californica]|uniref:transmembrane emp24 domain-containing protein p24delta9-like n=1 Tax=Aristolochia californica TaxID=171875 RepID=UPI0035DABB9A
MMGSSAFSTGFVILCLLSTSVLSLRFDLQSGHTKCIAEDIKINSMSVGKYNVVVPSEGHPPPDSHQITSRVTSPYGNSIHYADNVESGNFAFTSTEAGDYLACFWAPEHKPVATITVEFDWKTGVAAKDWSNVAKKGQVDVMELELRKLEDTIKSIHEEMFYLREREEEMQDLNRTTNTRMAVLTGLSFFICLSVAGLQLWHLKTFFERKKIL